jgi:hypothetical protein
MSPGYATECHVPDSSIVPVNSPKHAPASCWSLHGALWGDKIAKRQTYIRRPPPPNFTYRSSNIHRVVTSIKCDWHSITSPLAALQI